MKKAVLSLITLVVTFLACRKDEPIDPGPGDGPAPEVSPVVFDLDQVPYANLSAYHFFEGNMADLQPSFGVLPYDVITPLFSDYAKKSRFVWMKPGAKAAYVADTKVLDFDDGTVLIKNFYYEHVQPGDVKRILETRLLYKKDGEWHFAGYKWNAEQTEAVLDPMGSYAEVNWMDAEGELHYVDYRIPSPAECVTCHKDYDIAIPIGPKPQNINSTYNYPEGSMNQLAKWESVGYLESGYPTDIVTTVKWDDPSQDLTERVRSYLDMNCSHCHAEGKHCDYRPMRFAYSETTDPTNIGVCVEPDEVFNTALTHIVARGNSQRSVLSFRINSVDEAYRMPLLGRTVVHEEGVALIDGWINSLTPPCE